MKNRLLLLPLSAALLLVFSQPATAQDGATPTPTATPAASATPTPTPAPVDAEKAADSPVVPGDKAPSPVTQTTAESEAAASVAASPSPSPLALPTPEPSPSPAAASTDADFLPEPTDASLGAPVEPVPDALPNGEDVAPDDLPNPDNLIPQGISDADSEPPAPPKIVENKFDTQRKLQIRYQEVKLQALKDAGVRSLNEQAEAARTDEGKRQALREYYRLLFAKMVAIDATLKEKCDTMQQAYLRRLGQYRISPTIPLNPPPTPEPLTN